MLHCAYTEHIRFIHLSENPPVGYHDECAMNVGIPLPFWDAAVLGRHLKVELLDYILILLNSIFSFSGNSLTAFHDSYVVLYFHSSAQILACSYQCLLFSDFCVFESNHNACGILL